MFKWIRLILLVTVLIATVFVGMVFTSQNDTSISIVVFGYELPSVSVGLWLALSLLLGALIGWCLSLFPVLLFKRSHSAKDKKIQRLQTEINRLRMTGIKGK